MGRAMSTLPDGAEALATAREALEAASEAYRQGEWVAAREAATGAAMACLALAMAANWAPEGRPFERKGGR